jgi:hypothetical protein
MPGLIWMTVTSVRNLERGLFFISRLIGHFRSWFQGLLKCFTVTLVFDRSPIANKRISDGFDYSSTYSESYLVYFLVLFNSEWSWRILAYRWEWKCFWTFSQTWNAYLQPIIRGKIESDKVDSNQLKSIWSCTSHLSYSSKTMSRYLSVIVFIRDNVEISMTYWVEFSRNCRIHYKAMKFMRGNDTFNLFNP